MINQVKKKNDTLMRERWRFEGFFFLLRLFLPPGFYDQASEPVGDEETSQLSKTSLFSSCCKEQDKTHSTRPAVRTNGKLSLQRGDS